MQGIQDWLGKTSKHEFVDAYYQKLPYAVAGGGVEDRDLCDWGTIERILACRDADVMVCRRGERCDERPTTPEAARRLRDEGCTILIRRAEQHDSRLAELAACFARDFGGEVNVHLYATPADQYGFGWHYDAEDVFILQTEGAKEYSLRKNTVHPWPLVETIPRDMQYEREIMPLMNCLLRAGDWLYIPAGYWHMGTARETSISLALGVMAPAALDIYDFARRRLAQSLVWRQRLRNVGEASATDAKERREAMRDTLQMLAGDLSEVFQSDAFLDEVLQEFH